MPYTDGQDWMLGQSTVDFRNEERRARNEACPDDPPDPSEYQDQLEFPLAENGIDTNGDILPPESSQVGTDDPWPEGMF